MNRDSKGKRDFGVSFSLFFTEGFKSYGEVHTWLQAVLGVEASYKVVDNTVRLSNPIQIKSALRFANAPTV